MKMLFKLTLAGTALVAANAFADIIPPNTGTGNGQLMLFVKNLDQPTQVYARGLGTTTGSVFTPITLDDVLTSTYAATNFTGPVDSFSYSLPSGQIGPDSNLTAFLGADGGADHFVWTVMAGDTLGTGAGAQRYLTTSPIDLVNDNGSIPTNSKLGIFKNIGVNGGIVTQINTALPGTAIDDTSLLSGGLWGQQGSPYENATDWFGAGFNNANDVGDTAANFYVLTTETGGGVNVGRAFQSSFGLALLADGTLKSTGSVSEVPVPAAIWLLGSGLVGLAGVGRRRRAAVQAA